MRRLQSRRPVAEYIYELREGHVRRKQHAEENHESKENKPDKTSKRSSKGPDIVTRLFRTSDESFAVRMCRIGYLLISARM